MIMGGPGHIRQALIKIACKQSVAMVTEAAGAASSPQNILVQDPGTIVEAASLSCHDYTLFLSKLRQVCLRKLAFTHPALMQTHPELPALKSLKHLNFSSWACAQPHKY